MYGGPGNNGFINYRLAWTADSLRAQTRFTPVSLTDAERETKDKQLAAMARELEEVAKKEQELQEKRREIVAKMEAAWVPMCGNFGGDS